jgi:hypothetical protein
MANLLSREISDLAKTGIRGCFFGSGRSTVMKSFSGIEKSVVPDGIDPNANIPLHLLIYESYFVTFQYQKNHGSRRDLFSHR